MIRSTKNDFSDFDDLIVSNEKSKIFERRNKIQKQNNISNKSMFAFINVSNNVTKNQKNENNNVIHENKNSEIFDYENI